MISRNHEKNELSTVCRASGHDATRDDDSCLTQTPSQKEIKQTSLDRRKRSKNKNNKNNHKNTQLVDECLRCRPGDDDDFFISDVADDEESLVVAVAACFDDDDGDDALCFVSDLTSVADDDAWRCD